MALECLVIPKSGHFFKWVVNWVKIPRRESSCVKLNRRQMQIFNRVYGLLMHSDDLLEAKCISYLKYITRYSISFTQYQYNEKEGLPYVEHVVSMFAKNFSTPLTTRWNFIFSWIGTNITKSLMIDFLSNQHFANC